MVKEHILGKFTDVDGYDWRATLEIGKQNQPTVLLVREGSNRLDRYHLTQFFSIAAHCNEFRIAGCEIGDADYVLGAAAANAIAQQALGLLSRQDGHYEIRWVPNDPKVPF